MSVYVWNEKMITSDDGYGYRVGEADEGEVVVYYFEDTKDGRKESEHFRVYAGELGEALLKALGEKFDEIKQRESEETNETSSTSQ